MTNDLQQNFGGKIFNFIICRGYFISQLQALVHVSVRYCTHFNASICGKSFTFFKRNAWQLIIFSKNEDYIFTNSYSF